jgi:transcriptional regulator with XRE-family HTH domain
MNDEPGPTIRRRQLARQLRQLRLAAGFKSQEAAAKATGLSRPTISRAESSEHVILPKTVQLLCHAYGVEAPERDHLVRLAAEAEDRGWLLEHAGTVRNWFSRYVAEENEATKIRGYDAGFVPGLLQTRRYIEAVIAAAREGATTEEVEASVAFRQARQARLDGESPPELWLVLDEAAIRRQVGGPDVMCEQLDHLIEMAGRPNITLQVIPFSVGAHPAMTGPFKLLSFPASAGLGTIYVEVETGALYPDEPSDYERYDWIFDQLCELALSPDDTISLLTTLRAA